MKRRVVITGQGTINALGHNVPDTIHAMQKGTCAIGPLEFEDVERLSIRIGAQIKKYDPTEHFTNAQLGLFDLYTQYAMLAAAEAVAQAGDCLTRTSGVIVGTAGGGLQTQETNYRKVFQAGKNRVHPFTVPRLMHSAAASHISMRYNLQGPAYTVSTACASSNHAIGQAFQMVRSGMADTMLAGGSEAMLCFGGIKAWEGLRVLSPDGCHPFSATRNGMVQGEGAAMFVLESREAALKRGAEILAEVAGFSMTSDASDILVPNQKGAEQAMRNCLKDAELSPNDIGYINAHGTGTQVNDRIEAKAINQVFGTKPPPVSSTKSMHGHAIGATGAIELLACIAALRSGILPPTIGDCINDPECPIDLICHKPRKAQIQATLSNAFAFGGMNAALALKHPL